MHLLMSAGMVLGPWSPSSLNVILVPCFQPRLILIDNILSLTELVWPSSFITCREIFIFLSQPRYNSSSVAYSSRSIGLSWVLPPKVPFLFSGIYRKAQKTFRAGIYYLEVGKGVVSAEKLAEDALGVTVKGVALAPATVVLW